MISITIDNLVKTFGKLAALDGISLRVEPGEIFFLLGPSGCGKTTLLRNIAGFYIPDSGRILFGDEDVTRLPPHRRNTGMMFQSYALWPHMTVAKNVAFGLEERRVRPKEIQARVTEALESVHMGPYANRKIAQLSGGQQQRVALARALVIRPRALLLDEPLSNLDAKLRLEMRTEIRRVCKESGLTAIYVTHDQKEALSISDRMAILEGGRIEPLRRRFHRRDEFHRRDDGLPRRDRGRGRNLRGPFPREDHRQNLPPVTRRERDPLDPPRMLEFCGDRWDAPRGEPCHRTYRRRRLSRRSGPIPVPRRRPGTQNFRAQPAALRTLAGH